MNKSSATSIYVTSGASRITYNCLMPRVFQLLNSSSPLVAVWGSRTTYWFTPHDASAEKHDLLRAPQQQFTMYWYTAISESFLMDSPLRAFITTYFLQRFQDILPTQFQNEFSNIQLCFCHFVYVSFSFWNILMSVQTEVCITFLLVLFEGFFLFHFFAGAEICISSLQLPLLHFRKEKPSTHNSASHP